MLLNNKIAFAGRKPGEGKEGFGGTRMKVGGGQETEESSGKERRRIQAVAKGCRWIQFSVA